jgi:hypothetical protein
MDNLIALFQQQMALLQSQADIVKAQAAAIQAMAGGDVTALTQVSQQVQLPMANGGTAVATQTSVVPVIAKPPDFSNLVGRKGTDLVVGAQTAAPSPVVKKEEPKVDVRPEVKARVPDAAPPQIDGLLRVKGVLEEIEAINAAARQAGGRLRFEVVADQAFFEALDTPHKRFTPLCDYETYLGLLSRCEVSFMPLRDTLFNRCKSDLKFLEAAGHRAVALASPTVYTNPRDG